MNKLCLGTPRNIAELVIIPVERINISSHKIKKGIWFHGSKEIAALVIYTPYNLSAFDIDGQELSVEELACDVPGLKEFLDNMENIGTFFSKK
ncbi:MAG: hypothetical protein ACMUIU_19160 [bacterium]